MRAFHNLSHRHNTSCDMGELVPVACVEVLPGDTFIHSSSVLARIAPLANPVMHDVEIRLHHWYVPNRLLWSEFEDWITGKVTGAKPTVTMDATAANWAVYDRFGVPHKSGLVLDALPVRAFNLVYNTNYRDQDLQTERTEDDCTLPRICWGKDYLTTARPAQQLGDPVSVPFSFTGVSDLPIDNLGYSAYGSEQGYDDAGTAIGGPTKTWTHLMTASTLQVVDNAPTADASVLETEGGIDIQDLRRSIALQRYAEARARFGSRYEDYLRFLGVNPRDGRLDRPEFLGGGSQRVAFSEVIVTAEAGGASPGDLYGHGIAGLGSRRYRKMFEEHGWVMTLLSVRPKTVYSDMVPRKFRRFDPMDVWQKELEVLPWQEVTTLETHKDGDSTVFGYVPRYDEYRHEMSHVSGTLRYGTEDDWHMARQLSVPPTLNSSFVTCTPTDRVYSDTTIPEVVATVQHNIKARRLVRASAALAGVGGGL